MYRKYFDHDFSFLYLLIIPQTWICDTLPNEYCNSFLDILYIGKIMPKKTVIMAKKELKKIPGLGWFSAFLFLLNRRLRPSLLEHVFYFENVC